MVRKYAFAWPLGNRLPIGIIYYYCWAKENTEKVLQQKDFLIELVDQQGGSRDTRTEDSETEPPHSS